MSGTDRPFRFQWWHGILLVLCLGALGQAADRMNGGARDRHDKPNVGAVSADPSPGLERVSEVQLVNWTKELLVYGVPCRNAVDALRRSTGQTMDSFGSRMAAYENAVRLKKICDLAKRRSSNIELPAGVRGRARLAARDAVVACAQSAGALGELGRLSSIILDGGAQPSVVRKMKGLRQEGDWQLVQCRKSSVEMAKLLGYQPLQFEAAAFKDL
ncbi:MAG: hypothetical protein VYD90_12705 [Pseudomonadota bacterium]|nr:hypothetical protein [Pseudomonadota bacterium]